MSKVVRSVKNVTKGYSSVQVKVRNATSNDAWGPTGQEMSEIAQMTFNGSNDFYEIMDMLDKRLNDKGKNWRHVLKSLKVLDYCLHEGSELVVTWARKNVYIIKTLREFQYMEDESRDVGQNVRISAKELTALIMDEERLRAERADRKSWKSRVTGINEYGPEGSGLSGIGESSHQRPQRHRPDEDENDLEYRLALEASKNEMEEEAKRRQSKDVGADTDDDLAKAIKLSKEEEELRRRELENQNANLLFDDTPAPTTQQQPQYTGWNQGYQQGGAVDLFGNPVYQQQPQNTGLLDTAYSQQFQQQPTGIQNGFQPGYDQFQQQPQQQFVQPQQTAFSTNNPYGQQNTDFGQFGQQQQPQQQQQSSLAAGTNNPWTAPQQPQADAMKPLPTGSNNPFASKFSQPQPQRSNTQPTLGTLAEQRTAIQFNQTQAPNPILQYSAPQQPQPHPTQQTQLAQKPMNPQHERLNQILASGEGMDTFGNTGDLRIPAQHTAPGTFVNSAGQNLNRLHEAQTGNNPFFSQQPTGFGGMQQTRVAPAQTGPANQFGGGAFGGGASPFGAGRQQQQQQGAGGSLIDL